jgi:hypothetical protein
MVKVIFDKWCHNILTENIKRNSIFHIDSIVPYHFSNIINNRDSPAFELYKSLDIIIGNDDAEGSFMLDSLDVLWNNTVNMKYGIPFDVFCKHIVTPFVENYFNHNTALVYVICKKYSSKDSLQQGRNVVDFYE